MKTSDNSFPDLIWSTSSESCNNTDTAPPRVIVVDPTHYCVSMKCSSLFLDIFVNAATISRLIFRELAYNITLDII